MVSIKLVVALAFTALTSAGIAPRYDALEAAARIVERCGTMGVMDIRNKAIPTKVNKMEVRICEGHPLEGKAGPEEKSTAAEGREVAAYSPEDLDVSNDNAANDDGTPPDETTPVPRDTMFEFDKRSCWKGDDFGCTRGYCWKRCGDPYDKGQWCWTAWSFGYGDWVQCRKTEDCYHRLTTMGCGAGCVKSKACGCSC